MQAYTIYFMDNNNKEVFHNVWDAENIQDAIDSATYDLQLDNHNSYTVLANQSIREDMEQIAFEMITLSMEHNGENEEEIKEQLKNLSDEELKNYIQYDEIDYYELFLLYTNDELIEKGYFKTEEEIINKQLEINYI